MDWTHTLTIIFSMVGSTYAFYLMIQKDIQRHDAELKDMRQEFSKRDALWADLLKQIHEIKLFQVEKK